MENIIMMKMGEILWKIVNPQLFSIFMVTLTIGDTQTFNNDLKN